MSDTEGLLAAVRDPDDVFGAMHDPEHSLVVAATNVFNEASGKQGELSDDVYILTAPFDTGDYERCPRALARGSLLPTEK